MIAGNRLLGFSIRVSNNSNINDHTDFCAYEPGTIPDSDRRTFQCDNKPKVARYVSVINGKKASAYYFFALCEVVVIGTEVIGTEAQGKCSLLFSFTYALVPFGEFQSAMMKCIIFHTMAPGALRF